MLKNYSPTVFEILARLNSFSLGWLGGAALRSHLWQANEGQELPTTHDVRCLTSTVASINLWVGEGTMLRDSPSLEIAHAELTQWAADKPSRMDIVYSCEELLVAVREYEEGIRGASSQ